MLINSNGYLDKKGTITVQFWDSDVQLYKPRYDFNLKSWIETATEEEVQQINTPKQIDNCPQLTLGDKITILEHENSLLKAQVEANATNNEFLESCIMEMAQMVYA